MLPEILKDVKRVRAAYRRVFEPTAQESADEMDRQIVLMDLRVFGYVDRPFDIQVGEGTALQLAGCEGRRSVVLRILTAINKAKEDLRESPEVPHE